MSLNFIQARELARQHHAANGPPDTTVATWGFQDAAAVYLVTGTPAWLDDGGPPDMDPTAYLVDRVSGRVTETTPMAELERLAKMVPVGTMPAERSIL